MTPVLALLVTNAPLTPYKLATAAFLANCLLCHASPAIQPITLATLVQWVTTGPIMELTAIVVPSKSLIALNVVQLTGLELLWFARSASQDSCKTIFA